MAGLNNPIESCLRLRLLLKGIARDNASAKRPRLPITFDVLSAMQQHLAPGRYYDHALLWSALTMGFYGFLRCSKFLARSSRAVSPLKIEDVELSHDRVALRLRHTKTHPTGVVHLSITRSGHAVCAVDALRHYLQLRGHSSGPLFRTASGSTIMREHFVNSIRLLCGRLGLDTSLYSGHSLRIGAATTAAARGLPDWLIKALGRWQSDCYQVYIHTPPKVLERVPQLLTGTAR